MKRNRETIGFTILEMLVVVGVIVVLTTMVITLTARFEHRGKERVIKSTFAMLDAALSEFAEYGYDYKYEDEEDNWPIFPLDCTGFDSGELQSALAEALDTEVSIDPVYDSNSSDYSGSAGLYFFLSQVPDCRGVLDRIDVSLVTNKDKNGDKLRIVVDGQSYPLNRIIDPWGRTIRYDYYEDESNPNADEARTFPLLTSAGADGEFGTLDDIKSNE